jgi:trypsin
MWDDTFAATQIALRPKTRRFSPALPLFAALAACHPTASTTLNNIREQHSPIIGGTYDYGDEAIVSLLAQNSAGDVTVCTATLIASNVLVTAAHCVAPTTIGNDNVFAVVFGFSLNNPDGATGVSAIHYDADFDPNHPEAGHDIAVVIMDQGVNLPPVPYNHDLLDRSLVGSQVRIVGYGVDESQDPNSAGVKRQVVTQLNDYNDMLILEGAPGRGSCAGDSGGPLLINAGGAEVLIGVTSYGSTNCFEEGDYDTRVDTFAAWLDTFTGHQPPPPPLVPPPQQPPSQSPPPSNPNNPSNPPPNTPPGNTCDQNFGVESESNDLPSRPNDMCRSGTMWAVIGSPGDVDWFKGDIPSGRQYTISLSYLAADYTMSLYRGDSGQLVHIADAADNHDLAPQTITGTADVGGTYYLRISGVQGAWDPNNPYLVSAQVQ